MLRDPLRGKTLNFVFTDGQMANKTFAHTFADDGTVTFSSDDKSEKAEPSRVTKKGIQYLLVPIRDRIFALSYKSDAGYTMTTVLDFETKKLVAFVSNDKMHEVQNGVFDEVSEERRNPRGNASAHN